MRTVRSLVVVHAAFLTACELTGPTTSPAPQFGRITAVVFDERWISTLRPDSVVAYYDSETGRLQVFGLRPDSRGRDASLSLEVCGPPIPRAYPFASVWNGPYGPERLALGAAADFWLPVDLPGGGNEFFTAVGFGSTGDPGDSLIVKEIDLKKGTIRGSFTFGAKSAGGTYAFRAAGSFWGRVVAHPGRCAVDEA